MKKIGKRAAAIILSLVMVISVMPEKVYEVSADTDFTTSTTSTVQVTEGDSGLVITWPKDAHAQTYSVLRAKSRFGDYEWIADTKENTYTDTNPNTSKYSNYYKIISDNGTESEPGSLEISMFGTNAYIFAPTDDRAKIDETVSTIFEKQHYNQFGNDRYLLAYKQGEYEWASKVQMGYYTQLMGLGKTPYDVSINNVETPAALPDDCVTCNFWVGLSNVTIADTDNTIRNDEVPELEEMFRWGASQAAPARRLNVERYAFFQWDYQYYEYDDPSLPINAPYASGGFIADSNFQQLAGSWSQQQYYYRNCNLEKGVYGVNWNQIVQGCTGITNENTIDNPIDELENPEEKVGLIEGIGRTNWNRRGCTTIVDSTPEMREKPFLYFDEEADKYKVFIPAMRKDSQGLSWSEDYMGDGTSISVDRYFYIANPDVDTAQTINKELKKGKNIIFRPGIYHVSEPINVTMPNTVLMGLGMATIIPDNDEAAIKVADVGGVSISDLILDAGDYSETLLTVGQEGCNKDHSYNPTVLHDVFYRVGGTGRVAKCDSCEVINSNDVIIDHTWIWRADHGDNVGWEENTAKNGLIVNGDNVVIYGLFVEHFQEYDIIWRGENGYTYFLQNEKCYDPQDQSGWMSHNGEKKGYASYKVTNNVQSHYALGLGIYDVFINTNGASIYLDNAIEVPNTPGVLIENACIVEIANADGPQVGINNIINGTTAGIRTGEGQNAGENGGYGIQRLLSYHNGISRSLPDIYKYPDSFDVVEETGETPSYDPAAEKDIVKDPFTSDNEKPIWEMTDQDYENRLNDGEDHSNNNNNNNNNTVKPITDSQNPVTVSGLKVGQRFTVGKYIYQITSVSGKAGNVKLYRVVTQYRKTLKTATVAKTVAYQGYTFKVTAIAKKGFTGCKKLKKVTMKKNVKTIGTSAFQGCKKLTTIKFKNVTTIGKKAFYNCKALKKVTIGAKVKTIKSKAFAKCAKITSVTLGKKVKTIKSKAFANSTKLKKITLKGTKVKKVSKNVFNAKVRKTVKVSGKSKSKKVVLKSLKRTK